MNDWLTTSEAAEVARRHPTVIQRALATGELIGYRRGSRGHYRINRSDLDAWIRGETEPSTTTRKSKTVRRARQAA